MLNIGVVNANTCTLCENGAESIDHMFFTCSFSSYVWSLCKLKLGLSTSMDPWLRKQQSRRKNSNRKQSNMLLLGGCLEQLYDTSGEREMKEYSKVKWGTKSWFLDACIMMSSHYYNTAFGLLTRVITFSVTGPRIKVAGKEMQQLNYDCSVILGPFCGFIYRNMNVVYMYRNFDLFVMTTSKLIFWGFGSILGLSWRTIAEGDS